MKLVVPLLFFAAIVGVHPLWAQKAIVSAPACYDLRVGEWSEKPHERPPATLALYDSLGTLGLERDRMLVRPVIHRGRYASGFWREVVPDSLEVVWTDGFSGVRMRLAVAEAELRGFATTFTDSFLEGEPIQIPTADVRAMPVECP